MQYYSALIVLLFFLGMPAFAEDRSDVFSNPDLSTRESIIEKDLQAAADHMNAETKEMDQQKLQNFGEKLNEDLKEVHEEHKNIIGSFEFEDKDAPYNDPRERLKKIELALELESFRYKADENWPNNYSNLVPVPNTYSREARLFGFYVSCTYRRPYKIPVRSIKDLTAAGSGPGVFFSYGKIDGDFVFGKETYDSPVTGKKKKFNINKMDLRLVGGYDFYNSDLSFIYTPYIGLGYRRLSDKSGGWEDWLLEQYKSFETVYNYLYMPFGIETLKHVNDQWDWGMNLEGRVLLYGTVDFQHSGIQGIYTIRDVSTGDLVQVNLQDTTSTLKGGYGFRVAFKPVKKFEKFNIFMQPYFDYWHIRKSHPEQSRATGLDKSQWVSVDDNGNAYKPVFEPESNIYEYGLRIGLQY